MKIGMKLSLMFAIAGSLALGLPAQAQNRGHGGGSGPAASQGSMSGGRPSVAPSNHSGAPVGTAQGGNQSGHWNHGDWDRFHHNHVNFFFGGGFGYPFYGYPYFGYPGYYGYGYAPYYGYGYPGYGYAPVAPGYTYDPQGVYNGRVVSGSRNRLSLAAQVQQQLAQAGYYRGEIDGVIGEGTRRAIKNYERANGLRVDGRIDNELLSTMGLG
jgi:hypothetical protein